MVPDKSSYEMAFRDAKGAFDAKLNLKAVCLLVIGFLADKEICRRDNSTWRRQSW